MTGTIRKIRRWGNEPTQTRRKWTLGVNAALAVLYFGGGFGLYRYVTAKDDEAQRQQVVDCLRRVDSRAEIRGMFLTTFDVIEESMTDPSAFDPVRLRLDERYPELDPTDC